MALNWIIVVWSVIAGASLAVGAIHFVAWLKQVGRGGRIDRRRAAVVAGSLVLWVVVVVLGSALLHADITHSVYLISATFLAAVVAISFELGTGMVRSLKIAAPLQTGEADVIDIGERKQRDERVWQERAFLLQVIDINPCLIFAKDRQGRFTLANQAVADLFGTTVRAVIGKTDADFNRNVEEVQSFRRTEMEVMDTMREQFIAEEHITDAAGKGHWLQTVKRPILDKDGTASQVLVSATDITARKQTELELERQRNELAHLARVTMLSELSGSLAHELNQPLTAILSNAQAGLRFLARNDPNLEEVRNILSDIVVDDKRAGEVIQGLRLLLKKGEMRLDRFDMNQVVRDVLRLVRSDMLNADVGLSIKLAPALPSVSGDRVQLQQVLLNLVVNGCEAMAGCAAADRRLIVSSELSDGECIRICVADQGRGIPADDLERVFEPFFTTKAEGLGLGLAVCRRIISAHGGHIWAINNAGRGATFCVTVQANSGEQE